MIFLVLALLLVSAATITLLFKIEIEKSLFIVVCSIVIILMISGIVGYLLIGYYLILCLMAVGFILAVGKIIFNKKTRAEFNILDYITPGVIVFMLASVLYAFVMRGKMIMVTDAAVHWGYATKCMYITNNIYNGIQTLSIPIFNYFIVKIAGFDESYLFVGRWIVMWAAICLPISKIKWDKWYKALIYAVLVYIICGTINTKPILHMDLPLGIFAGAIAALIAIDFKDKKSYIIVALGVIVLGNIKAASGLEMALFIFGLTFIVRFSDKNNKLSRYDIFGFSLLAISLVVSEILKRLTIKDIYSIVDIEAYIPLNYQDMIAKLTSGSIILLYIITLVSIIATILIYNKIYKKNKTKITKVVLLVSLILTGIFIVLTVFKLYSNIFSALSNRDQVLFITYWEKFLTKGYFGRQIRWLLGMLAAYIVSICVLCIKKEYVLKVSLQSAYIIICIFSYSLMLILAYLAVFPEIEASGFAANHRYIGTIIVFSVVLLTGYISLSNDMWINKKYQIICAMLLLALVSRDAPLLGSAYHLNVRGEANTHLSVVADAEIIKTHTNKDDRIYYINQNYDDFYLSGWSTNAWIRYEIAPRYLNWQDWSLGSEYNDVDRSTINIESDEWREILVKDYDYIYIFSSDNKFWSRYGELFGVGHKTNARALYEIIPEGKLKIVWQE
ncbi:MAG: hypothetical protein KAQ68_04180 [Clostridiales bacterium]|nr:hypothetical protein [Clostridiales bacterium]